MNASGTQSVISLQTIFEGDGELLLANGPLKSILQPGVIKGLQIFVLVEREFNDGQPR